MGSSGRRARRRQLAQESLEKEASHSGQQMDPASTSGPDSDREEEEDHEVLFHPRKKDIVIIPSSPGRVQEVPDCEMANMVTTLNGAIAAVSQETARIQRAYQQLCTENIARDKALADLTVMVRQHGSSPAATQPYGPPTPTARPRPAMQADVLDADGNLRAADIGITWEDNKTFLHGVRVVGPKFSRPTGQEPVMSTPYPRGGNDDQSSSSMTTQPPSPEMPVICLEREVHLHCSSPEARQGYRLAAPIQRFNNKSLNWPAWFRHFRAVADVHGWSKEQRALQLMSYLDETVMNVAQELGDNDLYNYDVLIKLLSDRFDPASRVSAFRSRFHVVITKMRTHSLMPSRSCAGSAIRRVHWNYDRS